MIGIFNIEDLKNAAMSKEEMWKALNGRTVKCIYLENSECKLFATQDIENKKVYILDESR